MPNTLFETLDIAAKTFVGLGRPNNEDAYQIIVPNGTINPTAIFLLADGMGGMGGGEIASRRALEQIVQSFFNPNADSDSLARLKNALEQANVDVRVNGTAEAGVAPIGTTAAGLVLPETGDLLVYNVGDCRVYRLMDHESQLELITRDQSVTQNKIESGLISEEDARETRESKVVAFLGQATPIQPFVKRVQPVIGDAYVICSDGVWDIFEREPNGRQQLMKLVRGTPAKIAVEKIIAFVLEHGAPDNATVIIVRLGTIAVRQRAPKLLIAGLALVSIVLLAVIAFVLLSIVNSSKTDQLALTESALSALSTSVAASQSAFTSALKPTTTVVPMTSAPLTQSGTVSAAPVTSTAVGSQTSVGTPRPIGTPNITLSGPSQLPHDLMASPPTNAVIVILATMTQTPTNTNTATVASPTFTATSTFTLSPTRTTTPSPTPTTMPSTPTATMTVTKTTTLSPTPTTAPSSTPTANMTVTLVPPPATSVPATPNQPQAIPESTPTTKMSLAPTVAATGSVTAPSATQTVTPKPTVTLIPVSPTTAPSPTHTPTLTHTPTTTYTPTATPLPLTGKLAFVANGRLYTWPINLAAPLTMKTAVPLNTGDDADYVPSWSHNGNLIAFIADSQKTYVLKVVSVTTPASATCPKTDSQLQSELGSAHLPTFLRFAPAWGKDDKWLLFSIKDGAKDELVILTLTDCKAKVFKTPQGLLSVYAPAVSPDGQNLALIEQTTTKTHMDFYKLVANEIQGGPTLITTQPFDPSSGSLDTTTGEGPTWSPDSTQLAFTEVAPDKTSKVCVLNISKPASVPVCVDAAPANSHMPTWSPDGNYLVFVSVGALYYAPVANGKLGQPVSIPSPDIPLIESPTFVPTPLSSDNLQQMT
ncbi:MAG: protein phosphatase 2C domain-containing protein [Aggregatilineales bacterium]